MTPEKKSTLKDLDAFVNEVKSISHNYISKPDDIPDETLEMLQSNFKSLIRRLGGVSDAVLNQLPANQRRIINYFQMSRDEQGKFLKPFISRLAEASSGEQATIFMAEFIKTHECHKIINSKRFEEINPEDRAHIKEMLGGLLGLQITDEFIRSIRHESVASILAYAASGLSDLHLKQYHEERYYRGYHKTVQEYLADKIQLSRTYARYDFRVENGEMLTAFCDGSGRSLEKISDLIYSYGGNSRRAPAKEVDSAYVNHETKTIVLCSATANGSVVGKQQASALEKARLSMINWIKSDSCTWEDKEEYLKSIQTIILNGGLMPTNNPQEHGRAKTYQGKALMESFGAESWDETFLSQVRESISLASYLSYFSDSSAGPLVAQAMYHANYFSVGADTLKIWEEMREVRRKSMGPEEDREFATFVLSKLSSVISTLSDPRVQLSMDAGGKGHLVHILEVCNGAMENHFTNFPAERGVTNEERALLLSISKDLKLVGEKLVAGGTTDHGRVIQQTLQTASLFSSSGMIDSRIQIGKLIDKGRAKTCRQDDARQATFPKGISKEKRKALVERLAKDLTDKLFYAEGRLGGEDYFLRRLCESIETVEPITEELGDFMRTHINVASRQIARAMGGCQGDFEAGAVGSTDALNYTDTWKVYRSKTAYLVAKSKFRSSFSSDCPTAVRFIDVINPFTKGNLRKEDVAKYCVDLAELILDVAGENKDSFILKSIENLDGPRSKKATTKKRAGMNLR